MLKMHGIHKSYKIGPNAVEVLKGIDLEVTNGEMVSIMGQSGSGKSTLMNIIGLLDRADRGSYSVDGTDVAQYSDRELSALRNRKIGFVFQSFFLLSRLSALDNVGVPLVYRGLHKAEIRQLSQTYLERVGMGERSHHRPNELSGGQQQRVAIARALVGQPSLILADEPTGSLDSRVGQEIMALFTALNQTEGMTVVIITHDAKVAAQCQRVVYMRDGYLATQAED